MRVDVATSRIPAAIGRTQAAQLAAGSLAACAVVALVDPSDSGRYPTCPTAALLGWDCPACGMLRGVHALTRGRILDALDHNLLLALAVPVAVAVWVRWVLQALGRPPRTFRMPAGALMMVVVGSALFSLLRNVPVSALSWLDSAS